VADSNDVLAYYETGVEVDRLAHGAGALELTRTKELLARHLEPGSRVADVGGGPGVYADWLADAAHRVVLVDPVGAHVETARTLAGEPARFGTRLGDARRLPFADASFDAVLLLGPPITSASGLSDSRRSARRLASPGRQGSSSPPRSAGMRGCSMRFATEGWEPARCSGTSSTRFVAVDASRRAAVAHRSPTPSSTFPRSCVTSSWPAG
jgi:SAM-dependent methyltransferase